jgi:hypothetical protein
LRFGEQEDDVGTRGWFTPVRKSSQQDPDLEQRGPEGTSGQQADLGAGAWFTPSRREPEQPRPASGPDSWSAPFEGRGTGADSWRTEAQDYRDRRAPDHGGRSQGFQDWNYEDQGFQDRDSRGADSRAGGPGAWPDPSGRGITAANRWAEVTKGGTPAGVNPNRRPAGTDEAMPADVPFRGARPIDVSAPRGASPRRGPAYGAAAASGAPRPPARRSESGALRRIRDTGAMRAIMDTSAMRTLMDTAAMQLLRERFAGRGKVVAVVGLSFWVVLAIAAISLAVLHK